MAEWQAITQDHFIISVIAHGFQISFHDNFPGVLWEVTRAPTDPNAHLAIRSEIQELIQKNAIIEVDDFPSLCLSPIFVIPKKTGDLRVILNLKKMNVFIPVQHFRMETLKVILQDLRSHDWAVSIDLKDAYLHVPIHPQSRRLLGFKFLGKAYTYKVLPFGLKDSPWVFSRIVATVIGHLRLQGIRIFYYLDDWLLVAESRPLLESHLLTTLRLSQRLGFIVNWKKLMLTPQRMPIYLGASLDIPRLIARPVERRVVVALQALIQELTMSWVAPALLWQRFLGHLASLVDLVPNCRLLMRPLQLHFLRFFTPLSDPQSKLIPLTQEVKDLCVAWASPVRLLEGNPFSPPPPCSGSDLRCLPLGLGSDSPASSGVGSLVEGGVLRPHQFSRAEGSVSGSQEFRGPCQRSVPSGSFGQHNSRVLYQLPRRDALSFSVSSGIGALWCLQRGIHLLAAHIPGEDNLVADFLSRGKFLPSEWTLNPLIFQRICRVLTLQPEIDLFASTLNFQLPKYCSRSRDPQAWKVDPLSFRWSGLRLYAFPPFSILPRVLEKIVQEGQT